MRGWKKKSASLTEYENMRMVSQKCFPAGISKLQIMYRIMFPVCRPVMVTIAILTFMHAWNEFPFARVLVISDKLKTIPIGLTYFTSQYTTRYTLLLAALALATLPLIVLYLFSYRVTIHGLFPLRP